MNTTPKVAIVCLAAILLSATACGGASDGKAANGGETVKLVVYSQAGSLRDLVDKTVIPAFVAQNPGVTVTQVPGTAGQNMSKIIAQRGRPQADLVFANDVSIPLGKKAGVLIKLDPKLIPNLSDIYDAAKDPDGYGVAFGITATTLAYNTKVFKEKGWSAPTDWADLFDPKYKGHVVIHDISNGFGSSFLAAYNQQLGGDYSNPDPVFKKVKTLLPNLLTLATESSAFDNAFKNGSGWIGENGATRISVLKAAGVPIEVVYPKSGGAFITGTAAIPKGSAHSAEAAKFLNFILTPAMQQEIARTQFYSPSNTKTTLPPEVAKSVPFGQKFIDSLTVLKWDQLAAVLPDWTSRWNTQVLGS